MPTPSALDVVAYWRDAGAAAWFTKNVAFDARFRERFLVAHEAAASRALDTWAESAEGSLALLILLDQFPRNCFRGTAHMYATDPLARHFACRALQAGHDRTIEPALRLFMYLPFAHSELLADQDLSLQLHLGLGEDMAKHARGHRDIVRRFGRFPHRNAMLGRDTTPDETVFLSEGGFSG
jgi:uncharacterized protein (DUF924 family)